MRDGRPVGTAAADGANRGVRLPVAGSPRPNAGAAAAAGAAAGAATLGGAAGPGGSTATTNYIRTALQLAEMIASARARDLSRYAPAGVTSCVVRMRFPVLGDGAAQRILVEEQLNQALIDADAAVLASRGIRRAAATRRRVLTYTGAVNVLTLHYNWRTDAESALWRERIEALAISARLPTPLPPFDANASSVPARRG
jgi:hypothetical protein